MNTLQNMMFGAALGAAVVALPPLLDEHVARVVSRSLYDCGIRIASDIVAGNESGPLTILNSKLRTGHKYAVCTG